MSRLIPVTVAHGDGIGPEIMDAALFILKEAGAELDIERINVGKQVYENGYNTGIEPAGWESLKRTRLLLKAPITTPQGGGMTSLNVTIRKTLGLYANIRPCASYFPFVQTHHPDLDMVIIRENEEDLYAGIEYRQTQDMMQCLKLMSSPGSEKLIRFAFEYTRLSGRKKISCLAKDNIMKMTDGLFHRLFDRIGHEYPDIQKEFLIVDIGMARVASRPERFDVVVVPNLYGDILSDIVAELTGSVGLAGSANIGDRFAFFEAIHGSAPDIAGKQIANPSGLLLAAVYMLDFIGQNTIAQRIHNAWLTTLEDGIHTRDICNDRYTKACVSTTEFSRAVVERLGKTPSHFKPVVYRSAETPRGFHSERVPEKKELAGVDVYLDWRGTDGNDLAQKLNAAGGPLRLEMITNRGVNVWPGGFPETFCTDHWRCRFFGTPQRPPSHDDILEVLKKIQAMGLECIKTENLYTFNGKPGYSSGQGE